MNSQVRPSSFEEIAPLFRPGTLWRDKNSASPRDDWQVATAASRRSFVKMVGAGAMTVGLGALGVLRFAKPAGADGFDMVAGCNGLDYPNCAGCCCSTNCTDCCFASGDTYWHKHSLSGPQYNLRPNQCAPGGASSGTSYDGWTWSSMFANECAPACPGQKKKWKCHDGYLLTSSGVIPTICPLPIVCHN